MPKKRPFDRTLPIGAWGQWFRNGERESGPIAGLVTATSDDGVLEMLIFPRNSITGMVISGVQHIDDPDLNERPEARRNNGAWDFVPGDSRCLGWVPLSASSEVGNPELWRGEPTADDSARAVVTADSDYELLRLSDAGKEATEIAELMSVKTGERWNHQRVNHHLRRIRKQQGSEQDQPAES